MKSHILLFCILSFTACIHCSESEKKKTTQNRDNTPIEKTIKTIIISARYFPGPVQIGNRHYQEYFQWLYEAYCYKKTAYYSDPYTASYEGDIVHGTLIAKVYKKDGSFFETPGMTSKRNTNLMRSHFQDPANIDLYVDLLIPYSGEEVHLEVRRINKETDENVLLYKREIKDLTGSWEEAESWTNMPNGGGFGKESQCHISPGIM